MEIDRGFRNDEGPPRPDPRSPRPQPGRDAAEPRSFEPASEKLVFARAARFAVCFPYIAQIHQTPHSLPIAVELARRHPEIAVSIAALTDEHLDFARRYCALFPEARLGFHRLRLPERLRDGVNLKGRQVGRKLAGLVMNRAYFDQFDAIVAPERTTLLLRRMGVRRPKLIWTRHGAGDRASGFRREIARFDFVLMAGGKLERRLLEDGLIEPGRYATGVYAKFDYVRETRRAASPLFANARPTVLYNPHFWRSLSSWRSVGMQVLDWFADQSRFNCVFAPHLRLFDPPGPDKYAAFEPYAGLSHMKIDLGSAASADMTYTLGSDIYLGDVSSQVAEFLVRPRPCAFLNPRRLRWREDPSFAFWHLGEVIEDVDALEDGLDRTRRRQPLRKELQIDYVRETFGAPQRPSAHIGADAIADYLRLAAKARGPAQRPIDPPRPRDAPAAAASLRRRGRLAARARAWSLLRLESVVHRAAGLPIALMAGGAAAADDPVGVIRQAYAQHYWAPDVPAEWLTIALALAAWPLAAPLAALICTGRSGAAVRARSARSLLRQGLDQMALALRRGILPPWYYVFELWDRDPRRPPRQYLGRTETKRGVYALLRPPLPCSPLRDKAKFAKWCADRQVTAAPVLLTVRDGAVEGGERPLPPRDLFIKPAAGRGGRDAEVWRLVAEGRYRNAAGVELDEPALRRRLLDLSRVADRIVQPRLTNHPALAGLGDGVLSTVRILTCLDEQRRPEATNAAFRMAAGANRNVDNFHAGGLAADVHLASGRLSAATDLGMFGDRGRLAFHPDTGAMIEGRTLPSWREALALARRAHRAFADHVVVGWDVALTPAGPIVVEGNGGPDVDIHQRVSRAPMGDGRFAELCAFHLRARARG